MAKKEINKLAEKPLNFIPHDEHGNYKIVKCCKNKSTYYCIFPGEPIAVICKSHIKDKLLMNGIERIFYYKSKKEIPIEDMGFEKESPTIQERIEKTKHENSNIYQTESICIRGIRSANSLIKLYQSFMDDDECNYGKDSTSYQIWHMAKKIQEEHISDLCKILINCQSKPKRIKKRG